MNETTTYRFLLDKSGKMISAILLWLLIISIIFSSCSSASRKIEKAEQLVRTTTPSFNKIGQEWNALHPCENDTFHKTAPDTIMLPGDTLYHYNWVTDTVAHHDTLTITKTVFKKIELRDTAFINDKQLLKLDVDSIGKLNRQLAAANQNIIDLTADNASSEKDKSKWIWWFIGAVVLLAGSNAFWIYSKFQIPKI